MTPPTIAILATLDTKGAEVAWLRERLEARGARALVVDMGVLGEPATPADVTREQVAEAGGTPLAEILKAPTRQTASPVMVAGARKLMAQRQADGLIHGMLGLGGTQGTPNSAAVMQAMPYGFPKVLVSTVASGDTSPFVDIKDITMMFSVGDILGLNPLTRKILDNAAGAVVGMAGSPLTLEVAAGGKPLVGMTNLGVLTDGAMHALDLFHQRGYEVIVFHAVGSGGRAMEQLVRDGVIGAVFDYALGEISDEVFGGLRAGGPERLSAAGDMGIPQVLCPGGAEHVGLMVEPDTVPERWADHAHVFHNPIILAPRLKGDELAQVAAEIATRLQRHTRGDAVFLFPLRGTSRYAVQGGPLHDPEGDTVFRNALRALLPDSVRFEELDTHAEDPAFVAAAVERLLALVEA